jgi:hypothetical protein
MAAWHSGQRSGSGERDAMREEAPVSMPRSVADNDRRAWKELQAERDALAARLAEAERLLRIAALDDGEGPHMFGQDAWDDLQIFLGTADSAPAVDPERVEIARCPRCGGLPRPTLMGRTICDRCGGLDVPQPPSPTVLRQIEALNADSTTAGRE